jgi:hypothetical protein
MKCKLRTVAFAILPRLRCLLLQAVGGWEPFAPRSTGIPRTRLRVAATTAITSPNAGAHAIYWFLCRQQLHLDVALAALEPGFPPITPAASLMSVRIAKQANTAKGNGKGKASADDFELRSSLANCDYRASLRRDLESGSGDMEGKKIELAESRLHGISPIPRKSGCLGIGL